MRLIDAPTIEATPVVNGGGKPCMMDEADAPTVIEWTVSTKRQHIADFVAQRWMVKVMDELKIVKELQIMSNEFSHSSFFRHLSHILDEASEMILQKLDCKKVVQCKDCRYSYCNKYCTNEQWKDDGCATVEIEADDFCSYGERRCDNG